MTELAARARAWIEADPDDVTRSALQALLDSGDQDQLSELMGSPLRFGTAGIRGEVGPGPARMNRAVVIRTTWGLARYLEDHALMGTVVVGFDARPSSRQFATDAVGVLTAAGLDVAFFHEPIPTPIVAFAAKTLDAVAAVVVTASHNPPRDNGYKVYGPSASQIVSPVDTIIQDNLMSAPPASTIPRSTDDESRHLGQDMIDLYREEVLGLRSRSTGSDLELVYTPIHGVGWASLSHVMDAAGHHNVHAVSAQVEPDGTFPTVDFPNPEEPGALDLAIDLATTIDADMIIANDPDADRLAAVVPVDGAWRPLTGNEIGVLLGDYLLRHHRGGRPIVASSIVSSPMMGLIASAHDALFEKTLTGFKWIVSAGMAREAEGAGEFLFGYEEALGYTVGRTVRDKDGISAALILTDLVADLTDVGSSVVGQLARLWERHGLWVSTQVSIAADGPTAMNALVEAVNELAVKPPESLAGIGVTGFVDYREGASSRPPWLGEQNLVELLLGEHGRVLVRPSGTEPKLKIYVDMTAPLDSGPAEKQRMSLEATAARVGSYLASTMDLG